MTEAITGLHDLRPGDLMFTEIRKPFAASIIVKLGQLLMGDRVRLGRISVDHVGVVVEQPRCRCGKPEVGPSPGCEWHAARADPALGAPAPVGPRLVQAMPSGAEEIEMTPARHWTAGVVYVRLPEDHPGQADDAAAIARLFVAQRVPYSFLSYAYLAAWLRGVKAERLAKHINRRGPYVRAPKAGNVGTVATLTADAIVAAADAQQDDPPRLGDSVRLPAEAICSVLADQAWTLAGKQVMPHGTRPQIVTPGGLFLRWFRRPGVVTGGAGLLESR